MRVQNANTAAPVGEPQFTGWCLDKEDLCVAKLCALPSGSPVANPADLNVAQTRRPAPKG